MKKWIKGMAVCILAVGLIIPNLHVSAAETIKKIRYVAIGDSIAVGYGLPDLSMGFVPQVGKALDAVTANLAVNGFTSGELLEALQNDEMRNTLSQANIISISIGSNDLLGPFSELIMGTLGSVMQNPSSMNDLNVMIKKMNELTVVLNAEETVAMFHGKIAQFEENWKEIVGELKEIAPNAQLLVNDLYNPYVGTTMIGVPIGAYAEKYIPSMNRILQQNIDQGYTLIPVYHAFQKTGLTNVNAAQLNYDPHPNQLGHHTIANLVKNALGLPVTTPAISTAKTKEIKTVWNGKIKNFEQKTLCVDNRYYLVSADEAAKEIGAKIDVDKEKQTMTLTKAGKKLVVAFNEKRAVINGKTVNLSTKVSMNGRHMMIPVEAFTKTFGGSYRYEAKANTLRIQIK